MTGTEIPSAAIVNDFVKTMRWDYANTPEPVRSLVIANLRGFWQWMHSDEMEGCQNATDQAFDARFRRGVTIRGIPVWVCADEFTSDKSTGVPWGPEQVWAIRRDDATEFVLTTEEEQHWGEIAADSVPEYVDDAGF